MRIMNEEHDIFTAHPSEGGGTSFVGYLQDVTRDELEQALGKPWPLLSHTLDGKVTTQWTIKIDGLLATIYDWKRDSAPEADERITWHIGGFHPDVAGLVNDII